MYSFSDSPLMRRIPAPRGRLTPLARILLFLVCFWAGRLFSGLPAVVSVLYQSGAEIWQLAQAYVSQTISAQEYQEALLALMLNGAGEPVARVMTLFGSGMLIGSAFLFVLAVDRRRVSEMALTLPQETGKWWSLPAAFLFGGLACGAAAGVCLASGAVTVSAAPDRAWLWIVLFILGYAVRAAADGWLLHSGLLSSLISYTRSPIRASVAVALFAALMYVPLGVSNLLPFWNLFLFFLFLSLLTIRTGCIWQACLFRVAWDCTQTILFGSAIYGESPVASFFVMESVPGRDLTGGGTWGIIGGLGSTLALVLCLAAVLYAWKPGREHTGETAA